MVVVQIQRRLTAQVSFVYGVPTSELPLVLLLKNICAGEAPADLSSASSDSEEATSTLSHGNASLMVVSSLETNPLLGVCGIQADLF